MYIITEKHGIFNTDSIPVISTDGRVVYANCNGQPRPISYKPEDFKTIADGIKAGAPYVELEN